MSACPVCAFRFIYLWPFNVPDFCVHVSVMDIMNRRRDMINADDSDSEWSTSNDDDDWD